MSTHTPEWDKPGKVGPVPSVWNDKKLPDILEVPQPRPIPAEFGLERGVTQHMPFSIPYVDGTSVEILRNQGEDEGPTVRQLQAMRRMDGQARALYRLITLPMRSALRGASIVAAENNGAKEADFIEKMLFTPPFAGGMRVIFSRVIAQMMQATFDGFAAFEQVYWIPSYGPLQGKVTLKKLAYRPAETVTFLADKNGSFAGLRQRTTFQGHTVDVKIPAASSCYLAVQEEERLFYGQSLFQSAFYHFDKKQKLYFISHLAGQRSAVGTRIGTIPSNASRQDKTAFSKALADLGLAQFMTLPSPDWKVDNLKEGGSFDYLSYINHHNSQMSKSVLAQFLDAAQGGGASDTSLVNFGEQDNSMFLLMLQTIMDDIADCINNYVIPKFVQWNFNSDAYPKFKWGALTAEQKAAIKDTFDKLATSASNLAVTSEFMFELEKKMAEEIGLDVDYKPIEARKLAEQKLQDAQSTLSTLETQLQTQEGTPAPTGDQGSQGGSPSENPPSGSSSAAAQTAALTEGISDDGELTVYQRALKLTSSLLDSIETGQ